MSETNGTRQKRRARNVEQILEAARSLVLEQGVEGLSLREVARRAEYSPAALYRYFASKEDLIAALGMDALRVLGDYVERVPAAGGSARLTALCEAYVRFAEESPQQFALFAKLRLPPTDWEHYIVVAWPFTLIIDAVRAAIDDGALPPQDPAEAALGLWALAHGFASLRAGHLHHVRADYLRMERAAFAAHVEGLKEGCSR